MDYKLAVLLMAGAQMCAALPACLTQCSPDYAPVCGSDRVSYGNACELQCKIRENPSLYQLFTGACESRPSFPNNNANSNYDSCVTQCSPDYAPVCGSDRVSYGNACELQCKIRENPSLYQLFTGACESRPSFPNNNANSNYDSCVTQCSPDYAPVCGSDRVSYGNACELQCKIRENPSLYQLFTGACESRPSFPNNNANSNYDSCVTQCSPDYAPVCGSDRVSYGNACELQCKIRENPSLYQLFTGACESRPSFPNTDANSNYDASCNCGTDYIPVCGSDAKTYPNTCHVSCKYSEGLRVAYEGECKPDVPHPNVCVCSNDDRPVCGSDDVTYINDCFLNCATIHNPTLQVMASGRCAPKRKEYKRLFGDRISYPQ